MAYDFILKREEIVSGDKVRLYYLLPGDRTHVVTINRSEHSAAMVTKIGRALAGDYGQRFGKRRGI